MTGGLCSKCTPYVAAINRTMCLPCNPGYYAPGGNVCVLCPKGRAWDPTNMCPFQCRPGTYCHSATWQNQTYCDYCDNCPAGSYSDDWAQTECIPCEKGRAQPRPGELSCVLCQPGSYQNMTNQENCLQCPADYYCPSYGTIDPVRCPSDQSCPAGSAQPISCRSMFTATSEGCKPTVELVAIITGSCIAAVALVGILLFRRYKEYVRKQGEEQQLLLAAKARQEPVYNGF